MLCAWIVPNCCWGSKSVSRVQIGSARLGVCGFCANSQGSHAPQCPVRRAATATEHQLSASFYSCNCAGPGARSRALEFHILGGRARRGPRCRRRPAAQTPARPALAAELFEALQCTPVTLAQTWRQQALFPSQFHQSARELRTVVPSIWSPVSIPAKLNSVSLSHFGIQALHTVE